jgi:hypothetical protein
MVKSFYDQVENDKYALAVDPFALFPDRLQTQ